MKFEEILPFLREGKRAILNNSNAKDAWFGGVWLACKAKLPDYFDDNGVQVFCDEWLSLACLDKDDRMAGGKDAWGIPTWAVMSDDWEIIDEK